VVALSFLGEVALTKRREKSGAVGARASELEENSILWVCVDGKQSRRLIYSP
jgi:hypothetical protein